MEASTWIIFAYNKKTNQYASLDERQAFDRGDAIYDWAQENPARYKTLQETPDIDVVALLEVGGI